MKNDRANCIMTVGENVGFDIDDVAKDSLDRESAVIDRWPDVFDDDAAPAIFGIWIG
jgi:hypothetical protein